MVCVMQQYTEYISHKWSPSTNLTKLYLSGPPAKIFYINHANCKYTKATGISSHPLLENPFVIEHWVLYYLTYSISSYSKYTRILIISTHLCPVTFGLMYCDLWIKDNLKIMPMGFIWGNKVCCLLFKCIKVNLIQMMICFKDI